MKFRHVLGWDSALAMKTINVLADDVLEVLSLHELNESHVSLGGVGASDGVLESLHLGWLLHVLVSSTGGLQVFLLVCCSFPAARSSLENGVISTSVIRDS